MLKAREGGKTRYTHNFPFSVLLEESFPFCMYLHIPLYRKQNLRFICLPVRKKKKTALGDHKMQCIFSLVN